MIRHIKLYYVIIGIIVGVIGVLFIKPTQNVIYKYPTPENAGKLIYKDKNGLCYKYISKEVNCDANEARLKDYPLTN